MPPLGPPVEEEVLFVVEVPPDVVLDEVLDAAGQLETVHCMLLSSGLFQVVVPLVKQI